MKCIAQTEGKRSWYKIRCLLLKLLNIAKARNFLEVSTSPECPQKTSRKSSKDFLLLCPVPETYFFYYYLIISIYFH